MEADHVAVNTHKTPKRIFILVWDERKPATELQAAYGHGRVPFGTKTPRPVLTACPLNRGLTLGKSETYKETIKEKSTILPYSIHKRIHSLGTGSDYSYHPPVTRHPPPARHPPPVPPASRTRTQGVSLGF